MTSPLSGIKVLDLTIYQNGPWATVMLSDMGADVIKIEDPVRGDPGRNVSMWGTTTGAVDVYFETMNRNKKSMTLNLKTPEGRELFCSLAEKADVVTQNFRVGVVEKLGIGYETIRRRNPRIIYASVSGYGSRGPDAREGVFDPLGQARGGLMFHASSSDEDVSPRIPGAPADQMGAVTLAYGVLLGVIARERHGVGQHVEVSQLSGQLTLQALAVNGYLLNGNLPRPRPRQEAGNPLFSSYRCGDGLWIALGGSPSDRYWPDACRAMGLEEMIDDPRSCNAQVRFENARELIEIMDRTFATRPRAEWIKVLKAHGVLCTPVQNYADVAVDPQVIENDYLAHIEHPTEGTLREVGVPVRLSETPGGARSRAPEFGQHTEEVLLEHGCSWEQLAAYREKGII